MGFISQNNRIIFSAGLITATCIHVFNSDKLFLISHIANMLAAIVAWIVACSMINIRKLFLLFPLLIISLVITLTGIIGFVITHYNEAVSISDVPDWIMVSSVIPVVFNSIVLIIIDIHEKKYHTKH